VLPVSRLVRVVLAFPAAQRVTSSSNIAAITCRPVPTASASRPSFAAPAISAIGNPSCARRSPVPRGEPVTAVGGASIAPVVCPERTREQRSLRAGHLRRRLAALAQSPLAAMGAAIRAACWNQWRAPRIRRQKEPMVAGAYGSGPSAAALIGTAIMGRQWPATSPRGCP
jgi:hypothetical protein